MSKFERLVLKSLSMILWLMVLDKYFPTGKKIVEEIDEYLKSE